MPRDPDHDDAAYMWSMHRALLELEEFSKGRLERDLFNDLLFQRAVERCIHIVGEMATRDSQETRDRTPEINWKGIISQRHVVAHGYDTIRYDLLWKVVETHAPRLRRALENILPETPDDPLPESPPRPDPPEPDEEHP